MKIYTKLGDTGYTTLQSNERVRKDHPLIEVIGEIDELNSHVGYLISIMDNFHDIDFLYQIQNLLFCLSTHLCDEQKTFDLPCSKIENEIDFIQKQIPSVNTFILPGGSKAAAQAHICRSIDRRVERRVISLLDHYPINCEIVRILNRISDYFYVLARKVNFEQGNDEKKWQNTCK
jgi:cob(I)alamin adenosyltransferase